MVTRSSRPPPQRKHGRNRDWRHLYGADVISMPDKWEYPWFAAWDLAFHCIAFAVIDRVSRVSTPGGPILHSRPGVRKKLARSVPD